MEQTDVPLADLTTMRVGGPAARLVTVSTTDELVDAVREVDEAEEPLLVVAGGSNLVIADGMTACAALMVASRIAPAVTDYCVYCRSHNHNGLDRALSLFQATALLELGMESTDGTGATLAFPLVRSAAALLTEVAEGEDPGPSLPGDLDPASAFGDSN